MRHTDVARTVQPYLFERVYDRPAAEIPGAERDGEWWVFDVAEAAAAVVSPMPRRASRWPRRRWSACSTISNVASATATPTRRWPGRPSTQHLRVTLEAALAAETGAGVRRRHLQRRRPDLRRGARRDRGCGHAVAFHSFDHSEEPHAKLRAPPRARLPAQGLTGFRGRESPRRYPTSGSPFTTSSGWPAAAAWLVARRAGSSETASSGISVSLDLFPLYTGARTYDEWERDVLEHVEREPSTRRIALHAHCLRASLARALSGGAAAQACTARWPSRGPLTRCPQTSSSAPRRDRLRRPRPSRAAWSEIGPR